MLPRYVKLVLEWTGLPGSEMCVERSDGLDTAYYWPISAAYKLFCWRKNDDRIKLFCGHF